MLAIILWVVALWLLIEVAGFLVQLALRIRDEIWSVRYEWLLRRREKVARIGRHSPCR